MGSSHEPEARTPTSPPPELLSRIGHPQSALETKISPTNSPNESSDQPLTGLKLWTTTTSLFLVTILHGLDLTIVAATVPSLTNAFKRVSDIGWYSSSYSLCAASFAFTFGKLYSLSIFPTRRVFAAAVCIFEAGSLLCTLAPTSWLFIIGRGLAGVGAAGMTSGAIVVLSWCFPGSARPLWTSLLGAFQMLGIVSAPVVGGALIDWVGWRGCFGVNLPPGVVAILFVVYGLEDDSLVAHTDENEVQLTWREKLHRFDILGTALMVPAVTCLFLALQWGGVRFGWSNALIIVLLILFGFLLVGFAWRQCRLQENATLPPRILKIRSVLAGLWFSACCNGVLAVTEYYVTIFFQGIKGYSATHSGTLMLPLLISVTVGGLLGGLGTSSLGYYNPFMITTTILAPIASGLLTTIRLDDALTKTLCLLGFLGVAVGVGIQAPVMALQTILKPNDLPIGVAAIAFGATMGNAVWIVVSAALFQNRLEEEVASQGLGLANTTMLEHSGLSEIRDIVGAERLLDVLMGYDRAIMQTLYLPVGLAVATLLGSALMDWKPVKKKQR
ncbi:MAG: hypothetical protein Q9227_004438 [Pyrenula ochraceoflavens]